jgi:hypothetical protein
MKPTIFLFGESKKGSFGSPLMCHSLENLCDYFGDPVEETLGIHYGVQTLLYNKDLVFCRVKEEGFSRSDYINGFSLLRKQAWTPQLQAIFIPGVGDEEIVEMATDVCHLYKSLLVIT